MGDDRYSRGAIAFHWVIALFVLANLFLGLAHESLLDGLKWVMPTHKAIGVTVLALTLGRIGWRLVHKPPHLPAAMPGWEKAVAKGVHFVFYALLLALPLTGWMLSSNPERPRPIDWFGLFQLPVLPIDKTAAMLGRTLHEPLGLLMTALVVLHVAGALRHHFILRDRVLARMLPAADRTR